MAEPNRNPAVDSYIAARAPFARPILTRIRETVHAACPEAVEKIKWSSPHFDYRGKPLCMMAAFKAHAAFGFWRGKEVVATSSELDAMGQFGALKSVGDLPPKEEFTALIQKAMALTDAGVKAPRPVKHAKPEVGTPAELAEAFAAGGAGQAFWDGLPPSGKREYAEWIESAKRPETRAKRVATTLAQLAEGKRHNWQYANC